MRSGVQLILSYQSNMCANDLSFKNALNFICVDLNNILDAVKRTVDADNLSYQSNMCVNDVIQERIEFNMR